MVVADQHRHNMPPEPPRTEAIVYGNGHDKDVSVHSIVIKAKTIAISVPISFRREASVHDDGKDDSVDPIVASARISERNASL